MSVRAKLTLAFLAITAIPLLLVSALTYINFKHSLESARISSLQDITAFKADRIETYFAQLKGNIEITQSLYNIKYNLPVLTRLAGDPNNPEFLAAHKTLDGQLQRIQTVLGLADVMLLNPDGKIVYITSPQDSAIEFLHRLPDPEQTAFEKGKNGIYFSDIFVYQAAGNRYEMLITAPVVDFNHVLIGVIAFEVEMAGIYKIIQDNTGLGKTGESVIGKKIGNEVLYLSPLRYDPNAALNKRITLGTNVAVPIQNAVQGKTGAAVAVDYRGRGVIGAWKYMPSLEWGLATKIDAGEAFADVTNLRNLAVIILAIVLIFSGILAFHIAKSISEPINQLALGAERIGSGDLNYKVGTTSKDEIGQLSRSFDKMTHDLETTLSSRDELNKEIEERKKAQAKLQQQMEELRQFNRLMVDREIRMIQLKKEINILCKRAGEPPRYEIDDLKEPL
jgi:HAMP domain-containing protein